MIGLYRSIYPENEPAASKFIAWQSTLTGHDYIFIQFGKQEKLKS